MLKKEYRYSPLTGVDSGTKDEYGVTDAQAAFDWATVDPQVLEQGSAIRRGPVVYTLLICRL